jgi:hypothetical protein
MNLAMTPTKKCFVFGGINMKLFKVEPKKYKCDACGFETMQSTNHYGPTWSWGHVNTCPKCPPFKKYPEFGGQTTWTCLETEPKLPGELK